MYLKAFKFRQSWRFNNLETTHEKSGEIYPKGKRKIKVSTNSCTICFPYEPSMDRPNVWPWHHFNHKGEEKERPQKEQKPWGRGSVRSDLEHWKMKLMSILGNSLKEIIQGTSSEIQFSERKRLNAISRVWSVGIESAQLNFMPHRSGFRTERAIKCILPAKELAYVQAIHCEPKIPKWHRFKKYLLSTVRSCQ